MLKPQISTFRADSIVELGTIQASIALDMPSKEGLVARLLSISGDANVNTSECLTEQCIISGRANFKALCVDDKNTIISLNYNVDFSDKLADKRINVDDKLIFECNIIDISTEVDEHGVKATAVVETTVKKVESKTQNFLTATEGIYTKEHQINISEFRGHIDDCFNIIHEHEVKRPIARIISAHGDVTLTNCVVGNNMLTLNGDVFLSVTYINANDMEVETVTTEIPFNEEIETKTNLNDCSINVAAKIKNIKISCEIADGADNNAFSAEIMVCVKGAAMMVNKINAAMDAFAMENELRLVHQSVESTLFGAMITSTAKVSGTVIIPPSSVEVHRICDCINNRVMILSCKCMEKQISFEGIVHGVVLYKNDDTLQSFAFEMPFSTAIDFADVDAKHFCNGQAAVVNINCRKDKGNTLEITASLKCSFNLTKQVVESVVSGCELGEQLQDLNYSPMQLFIINKGDTLWDVCKQLHTTEEQLSKQNPHLVFPLEQSARIVVYRPIKR